MIVAKVREDRTLAATSDPFLLATDLADYLVLKGVPFRDAHEVIGKLTAFSLTEKRGFPDLSLEEYRQFSPVFEPDLFKVLDLKTALEARKAIGARRPRTWEHRLPVGQSVCTLRHPLHKVFPKVRQNSPGHSLYLMKDERKREQ